MGRRWRFAAGGAMSGWMLLLGPVWVSAEQAAAAGGASASQNQTARIWALVAIVAGVTLFLGLELREEPTLTSWDLVVEALEVLPLVLRAWGSCCSSASRLASARISWC